MPNRSRGVFESAVMPMFAVWWTFLVIAYVSDTDWAWFTAKWSPVVLVPWTIAGIVRMSRR